MLDPIYINTVRLLLDVVPDVFADPLFAMKGGTAINLFTRDAPRLSVDIDLVYLNGAEPREVAFPAIAAGLQRIAARLEARKLTAQPVRTGADPESKLLVMEGHGGLISFADFPSRSSQCPKPTDRLSESRHSRS